MTFEIKKEKKYLNLQRITENRKKNLTSLFNRWYEQIFK